VLSDCPTECLIPASTPAKPGKSANRTNQVLLEMSGCPFLRTWNSLSAMGKANGSRLIFADYFVCNDLM
jgi:hypothetical protein